MTKISKIAWYEWILYSLFSLFSLLIIWAAVQSLSQVVSPFVPEYFYFLIHLMHLGNLLGAVTGLIGFILLISRKQPGWYFLFFGATTFVLLSFIPIYGLDPAFLPKKDYSLVFFLLIPVALLFRRSQGAYEVSQKSVLVVGGFILIALLLRFFSLLLFHALA